MRFLISALTALMLLATPVWAAGFVEDAVAGYEVGDWEDAEAAYKAKDYEKAFRIWKLFAEQGIAIAQSYLGYMYDRGEGVPEDDLKAIHWFQKALKQGHAFAQFNPVELENKAATPVVAGNFEDAYAA